MNKKQLLHTAMFSAAMLLGSSAVFAQVKIGTSPTTIGPNSNLEVEAANNKKIISDKATGTLKVENKPTAAITDSLVLRDANGELHQMSVGRLLSTLNIPVTVFASTLNANYPIPVIVADNDFAQHIPLTPSPGYEAGWNATTRQFTIPASGFYLISAGLGCVGTGSGGGTRLVTRIWPSTGAHPFVFGTGPISTNFGDTQSLSWSGFFAAGATINLNGYTTNMVPAAIPNPTVLLPLTTAVCSAGFLNIIKMK